MRRLVLVIVMIAAGCFAQSFEVASVKKSERILGPDYRGRVILGEDRVSAHNVTLKDLVVAAYHARPFEVSGPNWINEDEFDVDAIGGGDLERMMQSLLVERFRLRIHKQSREQRVNALVVDKGGLKIKPGGDGNFHGTMRRLAELLSIQLSIPAPVDPTKPAVASSTPVPVVDQTGLDGVFSFDVDIRPEMGTDMFALWQRYLRERLGLRLESQKIQTEFLVVDRAERVPVAN